MKKIIILAIALALGMAANAQSVQRNGNNFTQVVEKKASTSKETKTEFTYTDSKGNTYPVYLSSTGKAFVKKVSKKTGNEYKQYLPEIGKQINPAAYEEKKANK